MIYPPKLVKELDKVILLSDSDARMGLSVEPGFKFWGLIYADNGFYVAAGL